MSGDERWSRPSGLSPTDEQLLTLLREGRVDAEIAVRLGITTGDVKARLERIAARFGVSGRSEILEAASVREDPQAAAAAVPDFALGRSHLRLMLLTSTLTGVALGALLTWMAMRDSGATDSPSPLAMHGAVTIVVSAAPPPSATPSHRIETINGRRMEWAGTLFRARLQQGPIVSSISTREDLVVVTLSGPGLMLAGAGPPRCSVFDGAVGWGPDTAGRRFNIGFQVFDRETRLLCGSADSIGLYTASAANPKPSIVLFATGPGGAPYHLEVSKDGDLYVSAEPIPEDAVIDFTTGERLEMASAQKLGTVPQTAWTLCEPLGRCQVILRPAMTSVTLRLNAPADGALACRPDGVLELRAEGFTLEFHRLSSSGPDDPRCDSPASSTVRQGDEMAWGHYRLTATSAGGEPWSVGVALGGTLYVGPFATSYGCPCRTGN